MGVRIVWLAGLVALVVCLVGGCASPPRTAQDDASIKSVAVVSALSETAFIKRKGLTIFNNDDRSFTVGDVFNRAAVAAVEARVRSSRPSWAVKPAAASAATRSLFEYQRRRAESRADVPGYRDALVEIARAADVDALVLVFEHKMLETGNAGVGVTMTAMTLMPPSASARAYIGVALIDRSGAWLASAGSGLDDRRRLDLQALGLSSDLASLDEPGVSERVELALKGQLENQVAVVLQRMGY